MRGDDALVGVLNRQGVASKIHNFPASLHVEIVEGGTLTLGGGGGVAQTAEGDGKSVA